MPDTNWKVNYSELVDALKEDNKRVARRELDELRPRLCAYLRATMDASPQDAEDAVQEAFVKVYAKLMEGKLKVKKYFFKYLLQACRNEYLTLMRYENRQQGELNDVPDYLVSPSEQFKYLQDEDRQNLLKICIKTLSDKYQDFVRYYCNQTEWDPKAAAAYLGVSNNYLRQMKSRAIKRLSRCVDKKLKSENV